MRRNLATLLFLAAAACAGLAAGGWWLQRTVFTPSRSGDLADVVLEDPEIRNEVATVIAESTAPALGQPASEVRTFVDEIATTGPGAELMADIVSQAHARLIGARSEPVRITPEQMVQIVRDERAAVVPAVTLPVQPIGILETLRSVLRWLIIAAAAAAVVCAILAVFAHPERVDALRGLGATFVLLAVWMMVLGYVVPVHLVPAINDSTWTGAVPRLARHSFPFVLGTSVALFALGTVVFLTAGGSKRRRQWSTPLSFGRSQQHHWS